MLVFGVCHFSFVFVCLVVLLQSSAQQTEEEPCVCVWFYLCTNGTLIRDGSGLLEPRSSFKPACNQTGFVCCPFGSNKVGTNSPSEIPESTTPPTDENETAPNPDGTPSEPQGIPSGLPGSPSGLPGSPSRLPGTASGLPGTPSELPRTPSRLPGTPSELPGTPSELPRTPSGLPRTPSGLPRTPSGLPGTPSGLPGTPSGLPGTPSGLPGTPCGLPGTPSGLPGTPSELPGSPSEPQGTPRQPQGTPGSEPTGDAIDPIVVIEEKPKPIAHPVFVPKPGCGVKRVTIQQRITFTNIDESISRYAEFPWMLAVLTEENSEGFRFQCGASLIHEQVALTAAHCVDKFPVSSLRVRAGEWNTKSTEEPQPHQDRKVDRVELHPFYKPNDLRHDIALIFLDSPFNLTDNVDTICLPDPNSIFHGARCTVTGWGKDPTNPTGHYHNILHKVDVPIVPCTECEFRLRRTKLGPFFKLHHSFLCAGGEPEKDSCKGDGGGPLICPSAEENRWVQAGIVSWGIGCGTTAPGVYTDVSIHSGWIHRRLFEFEQPPPYALPFLHNPFYHGLF